MQFNNVLIKIIATLKLIYIIYKKLLLKKTLKNLKSKINNENIKK